LIFVGGQPGCDAGVLALIPFMAVTDSVLLETYKHASRQLLSFIKNLFTFNLHHASSLRTGMRINNPFQDTTLVDIHTISPEQQRALGVLNTNLPKWRAQLYEGQMELSQLTTNFMCFSSTPIKNLPHDSTWVWNQSNAKIHVQLNEQTFVSFQKMNTRKKKNAPKPPSHKLWMYTIHSTDSDIPRELFFLWCEKGILKQPLAVNAMPCTSPRGQTSTASPNSFMVVDQKNLVTDDSLAALFGTNTAPALTPLPYSSCSMVTPSPMNSDWNSGVETKSSPLHPELSLESLSFLSPFVEPSVAQEFGWY